MPSFIRQLQAWFSQSLLGRLVKRYSADRAGDYATLIAYSALFALFPILLSLFTIVGVALQGLGLQHLVRDAVQNAMPSQTSDPILQVLSLSAMNTGLLGLISFLGFLWGSSALFGTMEYAFNHVYRVSSRPFIHQKLMDVGMMLLFSVLVVVTMLGASTATLAVGFIEQYIPSAAPGVPQLVSLLGVVVSIASTFILIYALFWIVPNRSFRLGQIWKGAAVSSILLIGLQYLFPFYLRLTSGSNQYGAVFGLSLLLLTWFYFLGQILLIGTVLNAVLMEQTQPQPQPIEARQPETAERHPAPQPAQPQLAEADRPPTARRQVSPQPTPTGTPTTMPAREEVVAPVAPEASPPSYRRGAVLAASVLPLALAAVVALLVARRSKHTLE